MITSLRPQHAGVQDAQESCEPSAEIETQQSCQPSAEIEASREQLLQARARRMELQGVHSKLERLEVDASPQQSTGANHEEQQDTATKPEDGAQEMTAQLKLVRETGGVLRQWLHHCCLYMAFMAAHCVHWCWLVLIQWHLWTGLIYRSTGSIMQPASG